MEKAPRKTVKKLEKEMDTLRWELIHKKEKVKKLEKDLSIACDHSLAIHAASEALQIQMVLTYGEEKTDEEGNAYKVLTLPAYDVQELIDNYDKSAGKSAEKNEFVIVARGKIDDKERKDSHLA